MWHDRFLPTFCNEIPAMLGDAQIETSQNHTVKGFFDERCAKLGLLFKKFYYVFILISPGKNSEVKVWQN